MLPRHVLPRARSHGVSPGLTPTAGTSQPSAAARADGATLATGLVPLQQSASSGAAVPATPSPSGCAVSANYPDLSTSVPGATSGDGQTVCLVVVASVTYKPWLFRIINGVYTQVGDADGVPYTRLFSRSAGGSSKENPCRHGYQYVSYGKGISVEDTGTYSAISASPPKVVC